MMAQITDKMAELSAAATKVLFTLHLEPGASESRIMEVTGYSKRWVKRAYSDLAEAGLIALPAKDSTELSEGQQRSYRAMVDLGVEKKVALGLAQRIAPEEVAASIKYVQSKGQLANPAGYLVQRLRKRAQDGEVTPARAGGQMPLGNAQDDVIGSKTNTPVPASATAFSGAGTVAPVSSVGLGQNTVLTRQGSPDLDVEYQLLLHTYSAVTGVDPRLDPTVLDDVARLYEADYRVEHIQVVANDIWPKEWPGKTGERITRSALLRLIGYTRPGQKSATGTANSGGNAESPYLSDPYFHRDEQQDETGNAIKETAEDLSPENCPRCGQEVCQCAAAIPADIKLKWLNILPHIQASITNPNKHTWRRALADVKLIAYHEGEMILEVHDQRAMDDMEGQLLAYVVKEFNQYYWRGTPDQVIPIRLVVRDNR